MFMSDTHSYFALHISHVNPLLFHTYLQPITIHVCVWLWKKEESPVWFSSSPHSQSKLMHFALALVELIDSACVCCSHFLGEFINTPGDQVWSLNQLSLLTEFRSNTLLVLISNQSWSAPNLFRQTHNSLASNGDFRLKGGQSHLPGPHRASRRGRVKAGVVSLWS